MAQNTVKARFIIQHKTASAFASDTTVYYEGELLIEEDTLKMKVGDGSNTFANLDYINLNPTEVQNLINAAKHTHSNKSILDATTASFTTALLTKLNGIADGANKYVHPSTSGNKHIPSGGSSGQILRWSSDGTAVWGADNNTTYSNMTGASSSAAGKAGLVPAPSAGASNRYLRSDGTWVVPPDTNTTYSTGNATTAGITKLYTATGTGTDGTMTQKAITDALNGKASSSHTHNYAGSESAGGSANSAVKLDSSAGSATQPVYFSEGKPVACTYTLGKSVPSNAVFTDTKYDVASEQANGLMSASDKRKLDTVQQNANYYIHPSARGTSMGFWKIASDWSGHITNVSRVTKSDIEDLGFQTYEEVSNGGPGLMSVLDKMKLDNIEDNANYYKHPNYLKLANNTPELVKIQYEHNGHIEDVLPVTKSDLTSLGVADENHMHNYAGASNPGGAAYTAERLTTGTAGSSTTPVYFSNGSPVACNKSFDELKNEFILACYPVGSIYMSTSSTNPGSLFGGTWVAWGSGRVPVGVDANDTNFKTVEKTGGAATVALSVSNMPSHSHTVNSHTHSIPKLSGTAASNGAHTHRIALKYNSDAPINGQSARMTSGGSKTTSLNSDVADIESAGAHTHSVSTNAATSGGASPSTNSQGGGSAHNNLQPYITCYMWKRTA